MNNDMDQWVNEILCKSVPISTSTSFTQLSSFYDNESIFSNELFATSLNTSHTSSPPIKMEPVELTPDLDCVNNKLEMLQSNSAQALESIFETNDILKNPQEEPKYTGCNAPPKKRYPRKRLTDTQKQAHNKIEKKYRTNINTKIAGLQKIIPWVASERAAFETGKESDDAASELAHRLNKSMILEKATDYILHLQQTQREMEDELVALRRRVAVLEGI